MMMLMMMMMMMMGIGEGAPREETSRREAGGEKTEHNTRDTVFCQTVYSRVFQSL